MSKQIADYLDADTAAQQSHGEGMAQRIGRGAAEQETAPGEPGN